MIKAQIKRRLWLWQNQFLSLLLLYLVFPVLLFSLVGLSFRNIFTQSLNQVPYDQWVFPGILILIGAIVIFPPIYRDFFQLRIHKKILKTVALAPYTKQKLVLSFLIVSVLEALIVAMISSLFLSNLVSTGFSFFQLMSLFLFLILIYTLIGNIFISFCLAIESTSTLLIASISLFILLLFGSGLLFELAYFPITVQKILSFQPFGLLGQTIHNYYFHQNLNVNIIISIIILVGIWTVGNGVLLRKKLVQ